MLCPPLDDIHPLQIGNGNEVWASDRAWKSLMMTVKRVRDSHIWDTERHLNSCWQVAEVHSGANAWSHRAVSFQGISEAWTCIQSSIPEAPREQEADQGSRNPRRHFKTTSFWEELNMRSNLLILKEKFYTVINHYWCDLMEPISKAYVSSLKYFGPSLVSPQVPFSFPGNHHVTYRSLFAESN